VVSAVKVVFLYSFPNLLRKLVMLVAKAYQFGFTSEVRERTLNFSLSWGCFLSMKTEIDGLCQ